jgi:hypothetical protein
MANLLQDLEGTLEQSSNIETSISNHLKYYFNFNRDTKYEKRIHQELVSFFKEKKNNKNYFTLEGNHAKIKPVNFNSIMQFFLKRLWDEENFATIMKIPSSLVFIQEGTAHLKNAKVSLEDIQKQTSSFKLFSFIPPEKNFFSMQLSEQIKICADWIKNGNKQNALLERFKLIGGYVQTMYLLGQNLIKLGEDLEANKNVSAPTEVLNDTLIENRAGILTQIIMSHQLTEGGYLKFSEAPLRRSLILNAGNHLTKEGIGIKYIYSILTPAKSSGITDKEIAMAAGKILEDFKIAAFSEKKEDGKPSEGLDLKDIASVIDLILYQVRNIIRAAEEPAKMRNSIRILSENLNQTCPAISERHITLIYLYIKDIFKLGKTATKDIYDTFISIAEKLKVPVGEAKCIYYLIDSENLESLKEPLTTFIDKYSKEEKKELNDKQVEMLKSIMGNFPKEVIINQFHSVREKIKLKVEDPNKKKMIETISNPIYSKIKDIRFSHAESKLKEK